MPRCLRKDGRRAFFTGDSDCDADSVRRFRLDLEGDINSDSEMEGGDEKIEEKVDSLGQGRKSPDGEKGVTGTAQEPKTKTEAMVTEKVTDGGKNWWTCFQ